MFYYPITVDNFPQYHQRDDSLILSSNNHQSLLEIKDSYTEIFGDVLID